MVMKTQLKIAFRLLNRHIVRFFTVVAIILVSVGFMSGLGESKNKVKNSLNRYYKQQNISDLVLKSENPSGFSVAQIAYLIEEFGEDNVQIGFSYDVKLNQKVTRIYALNLNELKINKLNVIEGRLPESPFEVVSERKTKNISSYKVGEKVEYNGQIYTVSGIVENPLIMHEDKELSYLEEKSVEAALYFNYLPMVYPVTDVYVTLSDRNLFSNFSKSYLSQINDIKSSLEQKLEDATVLTLQQNFGVRSLNDYANKVGDIALIFVVFFLAVTALVVFSTMTRLLEEERAQIACQKTLGVSGFAIISKYIFFALIAALLGGGLAVGVGMGLTQILYNAFGTQYIMLPIAKNVALTYFAITFAIIVAVTLLVTLLVGLKMVKTKPVTLLTPKAPKKGRKVLLERVPFIWNKLSFKYKSCVRNIFLFRSRFYMTLISIIGTTVLVLAGLGLLDNTIALKAGASLAMISVALLVFAGLLCALVIYNLANINISERNREIATLMVLGYTNREVTGYIFREIYIMCAASALLGLPIGYGFMEFVFNYINFGKVSEVGWYSWCLAPVVTMVFTFLSTLLLRKKITKTDMNESLKTLE